MTHGLFAVGVLVASCDGSLPAPCGDGSCGSQISTKASFQLSSNRRVDLLFVIDDTSAIAPYTGRVATGLASMAERFTASGTDPDISLHAGFVRAGTCDATTRASTCGVAAPDAFLRSEYCDTVTNFNYGSSRADAFTCLGDFGGANCGPAQPLMTAVEWLTSPARAGWDGFLRPDALLMIVVVAATDDASGPPGSPASVVALADTLKALKPDPSQVAVSIVGPTGCSGDDMPDPRLRAFVNEFGANGLYMGLCSENLGATVDLAAISVGDFAPPCLRRVRDIDLQTPGLQASCVAESHSIQPDHSIRNAPLPLCDDGPPPCLHIGPTGGGCDGYAAWIEPTADWCAAAGLNFTVECLSCADPNDPACVPVR